MVSNNVGIIKEEIIIHGILCRDYIYFKDIFIFKPPITHFIPHKT